MNYPLDERIEDYLDGLMTSREARAFEEALLDPDVATALHEALALRSLLAALPPDDAPEGLTDRIEAALGVTSAAVAARARRERVPRLRAALAGAAWAFRGPALLANAAGADGMRTVAYAAAPLPRRAPTDDAPRPALWRRVLGRSLGLGK